MKIKMMGIIATGILLLSILGSCGTPSKPDVTTVPDTPTKNNETTTAPDTGSTGTPTTDDVNESDVPADEKPADTGHDAPATVTFTPGSPVSVLTDEDIAKLGINFSGTDREIAEAIRTWQEDNMIFASPEAGYYDATDPIRWNYFLPGIWPSIDIINEHLDNGHIYGVCQDFATIYSSIAGYYGLETRILNTFSKPSDGSGTPSMPGMSIDEYNRNRSQLLKYGLNYSYDAISSVAEETPTHYWAEVYLDGKWVIMDATQKSTGGNTQTEWIDTGDFMITDWMSRDMTVKLKKFAPAVSATDDLGQTGRATSIGEIMQGFALAPYFDDAADAVAFIGAQAFMSAADIREMNADKAAYEACSGKHLYLVSYLICDGDRLSGQAWLDRYEETSGEALDLKCGSAIIGID